MVGRPCCGWLLLLVTSLLSRCLPGIRAYERSAAIAYAREFYSSVNHDCESQYTACTPYSYWGGESCAYGSHGGDCANFVSQCLLAGNHTPLVKPPCRGKSFCNAEVGAQKLGSCLAQNYGWVSNCGKHAAPPSDIVPGDVLVFHKASCTDIEGHATLVVDRRGGFVGLAAHSIDTFNKSYLDYSQEFGYFDWLHWAPARDPDTM
jgi:hypothetical protein